MPSLPSPRKMLKTVVVLLRSPSRRCCSSCPWHCSCGDAACNAPYAAETREDGAATGRSSGRGGDGGTGCSGRPTASCILHHKVQRGANSGSCSLLKSPWQKACARTSRVSSRHTTCSAASPGHQLPARTVKVAGTAWISPSPCLPRSHVGVVGRRRQRTRLGRSGLRRAGGAGDTVCLSLGGSRWDFEHLGSEQPRHSPARTGPLVVPSR